MVGVSANRHTKSDTDTTHIYGAAAWTFDDLNDEINTANKQRRTGREAKRVRQRTSHREAKPNRKKIPDKEVKPEKKTTSNKEANPNRERTTDRGTTSERGGISGRKERPDREEKSERKDEKGTENRMRLHNISTFKTPGEKSNKHQLIMDVHKLAMENTGKQRLHIFSVFSSNIITDTILYS